MVNSILKEIVMRKDELKDDVIESIYFGGGTPSLLTAKELEMIFQTLQACFQISSSAEITMEANPDDLNLEKLVALKSTPINRLSIGVQSFFDEDLQWMNRAHSASIAERVIQDAQQIGFNHLTIDLIYGVPGLSNERWQANINKAIGLGIAHISSYCLTVEKGTALSHFIDKGKTASPSEEQALAQFEILTSTLLHHGFEQYEISNFAKDKKYAVHNSNYWKSVSYLGVGPSAHSFNGTQRSWNIANNVAYIKALANDELSLEVEILTAENRFNESIMTGLRTIWGCDLSVLKREFPSFVPLLMNQITVKENAGLVFVENDCLKLTAKGKFLADGIAADFFV